MQCSLRAVSYVVAMDPQAGHAGALFVRCQITKVPTTPPSSRPRPAAQEQVKQKDRNVLPARFFGAPSMLGARFLWTVFAERLYNRKVPFLFARKYQIGA